MSPHQSCSQEPEECGLHDNVAMNSKTAFKPLNYGKPALHLVIKFPKML